jgi:hypothetical protein
LAVQVLESGWSLLMAVFLADDIDAREMAFCIPNGTARRAMPAIMVWIRSTLIKKIPLVGVGAGRVTHGHVPWHPARGGPVV